MKIVALDTTTRAGSAALLDDDRVVEERAGDAARTHAERLPAEILSLLDTHGVALGEIDVFAVASGPGSFTGLRIGIATVQGLAFVTGRRVVGVSALDAVAHAASGDTGPGSVVGAWMDAHRRDVFSALYRVEGAAAFEESRLTIVEPASVGDPASVLDRWRPHLSAHAALFVGDGAALFRDAIARAAPSARVGGAPLLAGTVGRLAYRAALRGETVDPAGIQPLYVRRPDAEVARERAMKS